MGKGGGSGGGSGSGMIKHSPYMENIHCLWLNGTLPGGVPSTITYNMIADIGTAQGNNPYANKVAFDPATYLNTMMTYLTSTLAGLINTAYVLSDFGFDAAIAGAKTQVDAVINDNTYITAAVTAHSAILEDEVDAIVAKYQTGMRNINAVVSSAFVIGEALLRDTKQKEVDKLSADLRLQTVLQRNNAILQSVQTILQTKLSLLDLYKSTYGMIADATRVYIIAMKENYEENLRIDTAEALWKLELYQYGSNLLAGIGGGVSGVPGERARGPSQLQSALGGAMQGAGAGAMIGSVFPVVGTVIGAIGGAIAGGAAGFFGNR